MWGYGAVQQPVFSTQIPRWGGKGERLWQEAVLGTAAPPPPRPPFALWHTEGVWAEVHTRGHGEGEGGLVS